MDDEFSLLLIIVIIELLGVTIFLLSLSQIRSFIERRFKRTTK